MCWNFKILSIFTRCGYKNFWYILKIIPQVYIIDRTFFPYTIFLSYIAYMENYGTLLESWI